VVKKEKEDWRIESGSGGLVSALGPVLKEREGTWIGGPVAGNLYEAVLLGSRRITIASHRTNNGFTAYMKYMILTCVAKP